MEKIRVGVVGCGSIGSEICKAIDSDEASGLDLGMELEFLIDTNPANIDRLCKSLTKTPDILKSDNTGLDRVLDTVNLVIECASQAAVREFIIPALKKGKEVMILSVGALLCESGLFEEIERIAKEKGCKVYSPSGAVAGIDRLKSGAICGIHKVELTTKKPPSGFEGNRYVKGQGKTVIEDIHTDVNAHLLLVVLYDRAERHVEAEAEYKRVLRETDDEVVWANYGHFLEKRGKYADSLDAFKNSLARCERKIVDESGIDVHSHDRTSPAGLSFYPIKSLTYMVI